MSIIDRTSDRIDFLVEHEFPAAKADLETALYKHGEAGKLTPADDAFVAQMINQFRLVKRDVVPNCTENGEELVTVDEAREWLNSVSAYRFQLEDKRPREIAKLYSAARRPMEEERQRKLIEADEDEFFSEASAAEGVEEWVSLPIWTVDEAVALSLGKNPKVVNRKSLVIGPASPFFKEFRLRVDVLQRAILAGDVQEPLRPMSVITWSKQQLSFSQAFDWLVDDPEMEQPETVSNKLHGSIEKTLRKLIVGMAVTHYGLSLVPDENKGSKAWVKISEDLKVLGIRLSDDSVDTHFTLSLKSARAQRQVTKDKKKLTPEW